jgi:hypothetical protein
MLLISSQLSIVDIKFKGVLDKILRGYLSAGVEGGKRVGGTLAKCLTKCENLLQGKRISFVVVKIF